MPDINVTKTVTTTTRTTLELTEDDVAEILCEKFGLPSGSDFQWQIRWEEFAGVQIVHETVETNDA